MPQYCLVKHHIVSSVIDGPDVGNEPDTLPISGDVTFYPLLDRGDSVVVTAGVEKVSHILDPISARIVNGRIFVNGEEGVKLFAGGPDTNPEKIRYRAKFTGLNVYGSKRLDLKDILFEAVPGGELSLAVAQPVPGAPYPGYSATIEQGIAQIEDARAEALGQVSGAVATEISEHLDSKASKSQLWHRGELGDRNLNVLSMSFPAGMWNQPSLELATLERGYPLEGVRGYLVMYAPTDSVLRAVQEFISFTSPHPRHFTRMWRTGSTWSEWEEQATLSAVTTALSDRSDEILGQVDAAIDERVVPLAEAVEATRADRIFWESPPGSGLWEIGYEGTLTPRHNGLTLYDTFSRVETELMGSTPDIGIPWAGRVGSWSSDGSVARSSGVSGILSTDTGEKSMKLEARLLITADSDVAQSIRFYLGATTQTAGNGYMAAVNISNSGFLTISPYTTLEGVSTRIGDQILGSSGMGFPSGGSGTVDLVIEIDALNVKTVATGPNGVPVESTGLLTEAQHELLGTWAVLRSATDNTDGFAVDSMKITTAPYPY